MRGFEGEIMRLTNEREKKTLHTYAERSAQDFCNYLRLHIKNEALYRNQKVIKGFIRISPGSHEEYHCGRTPESMCSFPITTFNSLHCPSEDGPQHIDSTYVLNSYKKKGLLTAPQPEYRWSAKFALSQLGKQRFEAIQRKLYEDGIRINHVWIIRDRKSYACYYRVEKAEQIELCGDKSIDVYSAYEFEFQH